MNDTGPIAAQAPSALTPLRLASLARQYFDSNPALVGATMITCRATIADLISAMEADAQPDPRGRIDALLASTDDRNWLAMGAAWRFIAERTPAKVADVLRVQHREPVGAQQYDIASADGTDWDPGAGRGVYQLHSTGWKRL